ncbi:MAG: hypothetical protein AMJ75_04275 [Phycisphaerae bacterium SM1_79]|nr:MAG: hypothetical protein AMJ75_04275 [Phycisphaerae bacterium SM1_79]
MLELVREGRRTQQLQAQEATLWNEFFAAHDLKNWESIVTLGEKIRRAGHAKPSMDWILAQGYFHTKHYGAAVDTQRQHLGPEEVRPDPKALAHNYRKLAEYLSFAYAETGNSEYEAEIGRGIRKVDQYKPGELRIPLEQCRAFGAIKYHLDAKEPITDAVWAAKFFSETTPGRFFRHIAIWVETLGTGDAEFALMYSEPSQPWDRRPTGDEQAEAIVDFKNLLEPPGKDYIERRSPNLYK